LANIAKALSFLGNGALHFTTHFLTIFLLKFYFQHGLKWDPFSYMREEMVGGWVWENEKENIPSFLIITIIKMCKFRYG
jgi:hypothetical protein